MRRLLLWFDARSRTHINTIALLFLLLISAIDYVTPAQVSTFVFYVAPIGIAGWFGGRMSGQSVGAVTCRTWCNEPDALVQAADRLMYEAKAGGKNALLHRMWHADGSEAPRARTRA